MLAPVVSNALAVGERGEPSLARRLDLKAVFSSILPVSTGPDEAIVHHVQPTWDHAVHALLLLLFILLVHRVRAGAEQCPLLADLLHH